MLTISSAKNSTLLFLASIGGVVWASTQSKTQFTSHVQMALYEENQRLLPRSRKLVLEEFDRAFQTIPELEGKKYEVQLQGNEVLFSMLTEKDVHTFLENAISVMVNELNRKVLSRGVYRFYKTDFDSPSLGSFVVKVHNRKKRTLFIDAQSAPIRDILSRIKTEMKNDFCYKMPTECASREVDWNFGAENPKEQPDGQNLQAAMTLLNCKEKMPGNFDCGECPDSLPKTSRPRPRTRPEILSDFATQSPETASLPVQFYMPFYPLTE
jgi:hypothetical protein